MDVRVESKFGNCSCGFGSLLRCVTLLGANMHFFPSLSRSPEDVVRRLDAVIADIREKYHRQAFEQPGAKGDVLIVAHGHILRAFAMRWTGRPLTETSLILEAGSVGTLRQVEIPVQHTPPRNHLLTVLLQLRAPPHRRASHHPRRRIRRRVGGHRRRHSNCARTYHLGPKEYNQQSTYTTSTNQTHHNTKLK